MVQGMDSMKKKILFVDDENNLCTVHQAYLIENGYICDTAADGHEAIERLGLKKYDAIMSDLIMPNTDGFDLLTILKKDFPDIKIIMMSSLDEECIIQLILKQGATAYLKKPFTVQTGKETLDKLFQLV